MSKIIAIIEIKNMAQCTYYAISFSAMAQITKIKIYNMWSKLQVLKSAQIIHAISPSK